MDLRFPAAFGAELILAAPEDDPGVISGGNCRVTVTGQGVSCATDVVIRKSEFEDLRVALFDALAGMRSGFSPTDGGIDIEFRPSEGRFGVYIKLRGWSPAPFLLEYSMTVDKPTLQAVHQQLKR